jgi:hypothetical protein
MGGVYASSHAKANDVKHGAHSFSFSSVLTFEPGRPAPGYILVRTQLHKEPIEDNKCNPVIKLTCVVAFTFHTLLGRVQIPNLGRRIGIRLYMVKIVQTLTN